jgi:hypothetical protein
MGLSGRQDQGVEAAFVNHSHFLWSARGPNNVRTPFILIEACDGFAGVGMIQRGADIGRHKPGLPVSQYSPHAVTLEVVLNQHVALLVLADTAATCRQPTVPARILIISISRHGSFS